jgi:hypothetical protein
LSSKPALRSAPEENARPAPVIDTARTSSSVLACSTTLRSSSPNCVFQAFIVSGRFSVIRSSPPRRSTSRVS